MEPLRRPRSFSGAIINAQFATATPPREIHEVSATCIDRHEGSVGLFRTVAPSQPKVKPVQFRRSRISDIFLSPELRARGLRDVVFLSASSRPFPAGSATRARGERQVRRYEGKRTYEGCIVMVEADNQPQLPLPDRLDLMNYSSHRLRMGLWRQRSRATGTRYLGRLSRRR
jgi:hypothetical protein